MARETKVGLLAGLVFIVVFAVILANRGQEDPLLSQVPLSTDRQVAFGEELVPSDPSSARGAVWNVPVERNHTAPFVIHEAVGAGERALESPTERAPDAVPTTHSGTRTIAFGGTGVARDMMAGGDAPSGRPPGRTSPGGSQEATPENAAATRTMSGLTAGGETPTAGPTETMARPLETPAALPQRVPSGPSNASREGAKYVVLAGDTLYGIAGKHYGKRSGALVRAIVAANRDALQDPDKLRVGAVLLLPELGVEKVVATGSAGAPAAPASRGILAASESKPPRAFGWYQVQRGDRYASIAREQLGDAKRWREVFELNKEKFPDPDRIRDGVLIKIPKSSGGAQH